MYFIHGGRGTGKTTILIVQSAMSGIPIMTTNYHRIAIYKDQAKRMGLKIPEPILWKGKQEACGYDIKQVFIDDGEQFINHLLLNTCGARCAGMTIGEPVFEMSKVKVNISSITLEE